jgi:hypothetical protein
MATVEIEEGQLRLLQAGYATLDKLYSHPEHGMDVKKILKKLDPNARIPEIDAAAPHVARMEKLENELTELKGNLTKGYEDYQRGQDWAKAREEFRLTDEGLTAAQKIAEDQKLTPRAAAALAVHEAPRPVEPSGFSPQGWDLFGTAGGTADEQADMKALLEDPDQWFDRTAGKMFSDAKRAGRLPVGFAA